MKLILDRKAALATEVADATRQLADLNRQADEARALLVRLQADIAEAERRVGSSEVAQLLEANEQLVFSMLRAQADAEMSTRALNEAARAAELDALTQLPNRVLLLDRFTQAIAIARRRRTRLSLLFLDLDRFKQINDTHGHGIGDEVLKRVAVTLASSVREADTVSRHGGDEFLILLTEVSQAADAVLIADKIIAALAVPSSIGELTMSFGASIGISIFPEDGEDAETLIERADAAMYYAKRHRLGSFTFHALDESRAAPAMAPAQVAPPAAGSRGAPEPLADSAGPIAGTDGEPLSPGVRAPGRHAAGAEQAQRRQAELLVAVAHRLRTPLTPIRTAAAMLGRLPADELLLPRVQSVIERQVAHLSQLVDDLLDASRVSTGELILERRAVDLALVVGAVVAGLRPAIEIRSQHFEVDLPEQALEVHGDPDRLTQAFGNLLDNASKYTPNGGSIRLSALGTPDAIEVTITDSGIGMGPDVLPNVFEPFTQDARAAALNGGGLGIGLTVVRALIEAHGGSVAASSPGAGLGSRFVVKLPRSPLAPSAAAG